MKKYTTKKREVTALYNPATPEFKQEVKRGVDFGITLYYAGDLLIAAIGHKKTIHVPDKGYIVFDGDKVDNMFEEEFNEKFEQTKAQKKENSMEDIDILEIKNEDNPKESVILVNHNKNKEEIRNNTLMNKIRKVAGVDTEINLNEEE